MATFSKEELNYIASQVKPYLLELARADSLEIDDVAVVDDYSGITSMPAYDNGGGLKRIVRVPLSVLAKPAEDAANNLKDAADHPTYIGEDYYVYKWNNDTKVYEKTDIYVRGEAFKVNVVWASEAEMKADTKTYDEGTYGMISTGDVEQQENGVVYVYKNGVWEFFVDMSGKRGADGKTAQFQIGTVTNGDTALASVVENGEDEDGNPIYLINLVLPKGDKGDQGIQGVRGEQGEQGVQGERGLQGEQGEQGEQGKTPIFEIGDIITLEPNEQATAELVFNGATTDGTPKYKLTISIPRGAKGENGSGSGNVLVATSGLVSGKTYLFKPNANNSAEGIFVEYEIPQIDTSTLATKDELNGKQDVITDLETIRQGAAKGATALQEHQDISHLASKDDIITVTNGDGTKYLSDSGEYKEVDALPSGGTSGQVLTKTDTGAEWKNQHVDLSDYAKMEDIPTKVSELENDAQYATNKSVDEKIEAIEIPDIPTDYLGCEDVGEQIDDSVEYLTTSHQSLSDDEKERVKSNIGVNVPIVDHGVNDSTFSLTPNKYHRWGVMTSLTLTLSSPNDTSVVNNYAFEFTSGETPTTLLVPSNIQWVNDVNIEANMRYQGIINSGIGVLVSVSNE